MVWHLKFNKMIFDLLEFYYKYIIRWPEKAQIRDLLASTLTFHALSIHAKFFQAYLCFHN